MAKEITEQIKKLLNDLAKIHDQIMNRNVQNHIGEEAYDKKLDELYNVVSARDFDERTLNRAIYKSKKRKSTLIQCLSIFNEKKDPKIRAWTQKFVANELNTDNKTDKYYLLQDLCQPNMHEVAITVLDKIHEIAMGEEDERCLGEALWLVGTLRQEASILVLLDIYKSVEDNLESFIKQNPIAFSRLPNICLKFCDERLNKLATLMFDKAENISLVYMDISPTNYSGYRSPSPQDVWTRDMKKQAAHYRIYAAWALAKMGKIEYKEFLERELIADSDLIEKFRASQAVCDLRNWEFDWNLHFINDNFMPKLREVKNT